MAGIHYLSFIPAENPVHRSQGVNLLLMVDNPGEDAAVTVRFYGSDGSDWREIFAQERSFQGHSHIHAYFHLPPACFAPETGAERRRRNWRCGWERRPPRPRNRDSSCFWNRNFRTMIVI